MKLVVIGMGLMGGSAALAMRRSGAVTSVYACDVSPQSVQKAVAMGVAEKGGCDPCEAARGADVVMVATPVLSMESIFRKIRPVLSPGAVVTDLGSVRVTVQLAARRSLGEKIARYAPCHPIAGGEQTGVEHSNPDMFIGKRVISTAEPDSDPDAVRIMEALWKGCGAEILRMSPERHDRIFGLMSHLPHVLAYAMVAMIAESREPELLLSMGGSGFLDFSRIAASSPVMWRDICLANRRAISDGLRRYRKELEIFQKALDEGNADTLVAEFALAARARRRLSSPAPKTKEKGQ
ncbi:prephenate dehydrogenase/arogenate dehydrogenase family protein [Mesosutterella sp. AGMB02718]|uniref:Prephenate dehydrogenase/arogenate dehydrogenase family protein n=1 Tax=Mesosutterella faecium TaxID=2925194 RepID=A0ABT7IL77_9BURK|nr:prephenate dehydrogenase/arogenate dehydrogenase family protein [Mesosutterella sp. AGMB02718]MDL2059127.1 prephenate dehydrogenase/arogenate dehydrogenase family protein [Mesosutterella sp. AGMB02718]